MNKSSLSIEAAGQQSSVSPIRRWLGLSALGAGLVAAWWQAGPSTTSIQAVALLTHVDCPVGKVALTRAELSEVAIETTPGQWHRFHFKVGEAPQATKAQTWQLADDVQALNVKCRFELPSGTEIRSRGQAKLPQKRAKVVVVDVGRCAQVSPSY